MTAYKWTTAEVERLAVETLSKQTDIATRGKNLSVLGEHIESQGERAQELAEKAGASFSQARSALQRARQQLDESKEIQSDTLRLIEEKTLCFPWLAQAITEYHEYRDLKAADILEHRIRPARRAAEEVRKHTAEKKELRRKFFLCRSRLRYYERLFPWLSEYVTEGIDDFVNQLAVTAEPDDDPVSGFMPKAEYDRLTDSERNQLALNRYWTGNRPAWQIGRDYERYIGYLYERDGYRVSYFGATEGLGDLGRDLIATRGDEKLVIQCKRWAQQKVIREKHIFQLYGTTVEYWIKSGGEHRTNKPLLFDDGSITGIRPVFVTSTTLSDLARTFAERLGVTVREELPFDESYPCIKCNVARKDGQKIYHLPFDQQYDNVVIEPERGEMYAKTTAEAEAAGFRRAWRWRPEPSD